MFNAGMSVGKINSNFEHLYKSNKAPKNQQERRDELLKLLRRRRIEAIDEKRKINDLFDDDNTNVEYNESMEFESTQIKKKNYYKPFHNRLMLSEWFKDVPQDLEENWLVKMCPLGNRNLVVAAQNITLSYSRVGVEKCTFRSFLPGGGGITASNDKFTVLDCIFSRKQKCYYILDVIAWNSLSVRKCDTDFRFFWLKSKFEETPELQEKSPNNQYPFVMLHFYPAELSVIENLFSKPFFEVEDDSSSGLDGVLFYHKKTTYVNGITPLVGWLKPYMLPEMLNIPVHECYMKGRPENYVTLANYLERKEKLKNKKKRHIEIMDVQS